VPVFLVVVVTVVPEDPLPKPVTELNPICPDPAVGDEVPAMITPAVMVNHFGHAVSPLILNFGSFDPQRQCCE
jgi:hypothetical protein